MDSKTLVYKLAKQMGTDTKNVNALINSFVEVICQKTSDLDSIAIPGFGNFVSMKKPERIETDRTTGERRLMPPQIKMEFVAAAMLKKRLSNE